MQQFLLAEAKLSEILKILSILSKNLLCAPACPP